MHPAYRPSRILIILLLSGVYAVAQYGITGNPGDPYRIARPSLAGFGAPSNPCPAVGATYTDITNSVYYACPSNGGNWFNVGTAGTGVTSVGASFTGGLVSVSGSPVTTTGTLAFTIAGTSGGVPYFSSSSAWASSAALAANALMIGGGAGSAPSTTTTAAGVLTFLGTPTSANLVAMLTTSTGTGLNVFNNGPTLIAPILGTPASGNATNLTNLPITLTTTGTSGASTYTQSTNTLNVPQYTGGGSGTVTSFSSGALSPLFTTSVATSTTTPALSFSLSSAAQNSVFAGPASGGSGAPSFQTAPTISAANMTSFPTLNQNTSGTAANLSGTPALPNGTTATTQAMSDNTTKLATDAFVIANAGTPGPTGPTGPAGPAGSVPLPYGPVALTAQSSNVTVTAATHGNGTHPVVFAADSTGHATLIDYNCLDGSSAAVGCTAATSTGNVVLNFSSAAPFTGTYIIGTTGGNFTGIGGGSVSTPTYNNGGTTTITWTNPGDIAYLGGTISGSTTIAVSAPPGNTGPFYLRGCQNSTGGYQLTYPGSFNAVFNLDPTPSACTLIGPIAYDSNTSTYDGRGTTTANFPITEIWTVGTGGVTANTCTNKDSSNPAKIVAATGAGCYGIALTTVAATGTVTIARYGIATLLADNAITAGDQIIPGTGTVTYGKDSGQTSSSAISIATRIIGSALTSASMGSPFQIALAPDHFGTLITSTGAHALTFVFNGNGSTVATGTSTAAVIPFSCTINHWDISANAGTATVQFWKVATGTAIPTSGNSISTSGVSLSTGTAVRSATLTDFTTTSIAVGDIIIGNLVTVSGAQWVTAQLECQ